MSNPDPSKEAAKSLSTSTSPTSPTKTDAAATAEAAAARLHRPIMQSMPDTRQQSFDEIYGPPENFLEIEVRIAHHTSGIIPPNSIRHGIHGLGRRNLITAGIKRQH